MSMFREYDIRGIVHEELDEDMILRIGKALGTEVQGKFIVGRDNRTHGEWVKNTFVKGLLSTGCDVIDIGFVTSPMLYFASKHYKNEASVMVTASHNPKEYNGFKIIKNKEPFHGEQIYMLGELAKSGPFKKGSGRIFQKSITQHYYDFFKDKKIGKKFKVVVDCGNGAASPFAADILTMLGCEVIPLYCIPDGTFPNHEPDPVVEENMKDLKEKVIESNADIGIGFDGDADRVGVVDENGKIIPGDKILIILSRDLLEEHPDEKIIFEVKCSMTLEQDILRHGGIPIRYKTGHSLIKMKMKEENAALAGEMSGHFFFRELSFFDDAMYATWKILNIMAKKDKKMSELLDNVPKTYATPEIREECPDELKQDIMSKLSKRFSKYNPLTLDGIRIDFGDGWGLVRPSNTQPVLVMRFEAKDKKRLKYIKNLIETEVKDVKGHALAEKG